MDERLKEAYELLKQGDRHSALTLIMQVIQQNRDCADAWFLLAAARQDMNGKWMAVNRALKINPNHKAAQQLRQRLENAAPPSSPSSPNPSVPIADVEEKPARSSIIVPLSASDSPSFQAEQSNCILPLPNNNTLGAIEESLTAGKVPVTVFDDSDPWYLFTLPAVAQSERVSNGQNSHRAPAVQALK